MNESTDTAAASRSGSRAENLKQRIKQDGKQQIESGKRAAADQIAEIADAIDVAGSQLDQSQPTLANYASQLAEGVGTLATRLREDSIEDIYSDVRQLANRHPGMFLLGGAALGLVIARFMKASSEASSSEAYSSNAYSSNDWAAEEDLGEQQSESDQALSEADDVDAAGAEGEDAEALTRARNAATPDPYGSPAYGA